MSLAVHRKIRNRLMTVYAIPLENARIMVNEYERSIGLQVIDDMMQLSHTQGEETLALVADQIADLHGYQPLPPKGKKGADA